MRSKGFTLIKLAVVLAIIAILAAILTPLVTQYVDEARVTRAREDVRIVAQGVGLHQRDTGRYPAFASVTVANTNVDVLMGVGTQPTDSSGSNWLASVTTASLDTRLNTNFFNITTAAGTGRISYRGPYMAAVDSDPWGNHYVVNAGILPSSAFIGFVLSAGPDGVISTVRLQSATGSFTVAGDDIAARIK